MSSLEEHDAMEETEPIAVTIVSAQLQLTQAWRTWLLVATSYHVRTACHVVHVVMVTNIMSH